MAAIHGIDLDKEIGNDNAQITPSKKKQNNFVFGDPADYEKLPENERVDLTQRMMDQHQQWAGNLDINI